MDRELEPVRRAFTITELLVVIGIVAVVIAILVPAIQKVREVANRTSCASNLRQLGMASHVYHTDYGFLPPGYYGPLTPGMSPEFPALPYDLSQGPWVGSLVALLPYMEQKNLRHALRDTKQSYPIPGASYSYKSSDPLGLSIGVQQESWWLNAENLKPLTGQVRLGMFTCPSDNIIDEATQNAFTGMWTDGPMSPISIMGLDGSTGALLGRTNYTGVAGYRSTNATFAGLLRNRSQISLGQVATADGTSNTLLFGESVGRDVKQPRTSFSWFGVGSLNTVYGTLNPQQNKLGRTGFRPLPELAFSSMHPPGVQFCFADGTVRLVRFTGIPAAFTAPFKPPPLPDNSPWGVLQQLAGWKDGQGRDVNDLID